jgi:hypothetical protein
MPKDSSSADKGLITKWLYHNTSYPPILAHNEIARPSVSDHLVADSIA